MKNRLSFLKHFYRKFFKGKRIDGNGERVDIFFNGQTDFQLFDLYQKSHFRRYEFAQSQITKELVCGDFACGTGYGSAMLSEKAREVVGIDINCDVINTIKKRYRSRKNLNFNCKNLLNITYISFFDAVISFETIEHFTETNILELFRVFKKSLKPDGKIIISTPYMQPEGPDAVKMGFHLTFDINEQKLITWLDEVGLMPEKFFYQNYISHDIQLNAREKDFIICIARSK
jgi:2-polyprenyl-3-methyl-5-hydroxy-6-metoxy-1,4-benzoquinol methylase